MKKVSLFVFLMLLTNLLAGCGLLSYFNSEEILSEQGTQNVDRLEVRICLKIRIP